jgi:hypothetical protein
MFRAPIRRWLRVDRLRRAGVTPAGPAIYSKRVFKKRPSPAQFLRVGIVRLGKRTPLGTNLQSGGVLKGKYEKEKQNWPWNERNGSSS